jgi:DNA modification methylase
VSVYYADDEVTLYHGDCVDVMRSLPDCSVDAVVTDPPYGLEFMGKEWDRPWAVSPTQGVGFAGREDNLTLPAFGDNRNANCRVCGGRQRGKKRCTCESPDWDRAPGSDMAEFQAWCLTWATEALRVLKPGGHLLAFGGTRTWHRLACAIEDAGFEVRDSIAWMYGSGFPKSLDVSKAINKAAGAERDRVSYTGGIASGSGNYGGGGEVHVGSKVGDEPLTPDALKWQGWGTALKPAFEPIVVARKPLIGTVAANVLAHGTGGLNVDGCRIGTTVETWPASRNYSAKEMSRPGSTLSDDAETQQTGPAPAGRWPANVILDESQAEALDRQSGVLQSPRTYQRSVVGGWDGNDIYGGGKGLPTLDVCESYGDTGGASRFFYTAKADANERPRVDGTAHPTVKPLDLMRYLVRLVTPPGGVVLEPFAGSGTTAEACIIEGFRCIAIEREADYLPLILARITKPIEVTLL